MCRITLRNEEKPSQTGPKAHFLEECCTEDSCLQLWPRVYGCEESSGAATGVTNARSMLLYDKNSQVRFTQKQHESHIITLP